MVFFLLKLPPPARPGTTCIPIAIQIDNCQENQIWLIRAFVILLFAQTHQVFFSHQNMIPQSHPLGVRRGSRELGVQVAGKLVAVWYQALWQNQRCVCLQVLSFSLKLHQHINFHIQFFTSFDHQILSANFSPAMSKVKSFEKRKNTNLATSNLFLSIGICKLTGVGSQKKGMGLGVSLFKRLRGYQLCDFTKIIVSVRVHLKMTFQLFLIFNDWKVDEMDLRNLLIGFALDFWIYFWIGDTLADHASTTARVWGQGG